MRHFLLRSACALAFLASAAQASAQTLRIALRQDLDTLAAALATTYVGRIVFAGLCDKLFDLNEKLEIVPQLATGYEWQTTTRSCFTCVPTSCSKTARDGRDSGQVHL